ncbi:hypothetical protein JRO89_XS01G0363800 [Xanthoceras sorbifolium]|uniref:GATA-type domain-containing protein n=1 Tax=Xanthoceras sorbifolium TaxID=99658 RepID=A0ABQ8INJ3_9ROSI|nr:hypothetical protein JRO89_XS01G0363800 [Xanthoceras sorbifolium]
MINSFFVFFFSLDEQGSEPESMNNSPTYVFNETKKSCVDCHTTRTPLWRGGPAGPRSLCNACGIRYRKTKKAMLGLENGRTEKGGKKNRRDHSSKLQVSLKMGLMAVGREMMLKKSMGEEEQAAMLLMALSCGYVYA